MNNQILVVVGADGRILHTEQDGVFRRSNKQNELVALLLYPTAKTVKVNFLRPDGVKPKSQYMAYMGQQEYEGVMYNAYNYFLSDFQLYATGPLVVSLDIISGNVTATSGDFTIDVEASEGQNDDETPTDTNQYDEAIQSLMQTDRELIDRTKNVPDLVQSIQKVEGKNSFTFTKENGVTSAEISFGDLYAEPNPVTAASAIRIPQDSSGWQLGDGHYTFTVTADVHGQMIDGATPNDLWVSFDEAESDSFKGAYEDYTVNAAGDITITVSSPVDMTVRVWNGKGLVDTQARKDIAAETDRAEAEEEKLQTQINELVNTGVDAVARADIAAETQRAETAEEDLQNQITAETTRAQSAEATLTSDIQGLREDITNESHFRGMFDSVEALRDAYPTATPNDYAYIVGGNQWIYTNGAWTDSDVPSPNTAVPAGNMLPRMDGVANAGVSSNYSREDHVHAENNKKADLAGAEFEGDIYAPTVTGEEVYGESGVYDNGSRVYSVSNPPSYPVRSVNGKTGAVVTTKTDVGLSNVANERQWSDNNRPTALGYVSGGGTNRTEQTDTVVAYYTNIDGTMWYRRWASGWKECGGTNSYNIGAIINKVTSIAMPLSFDSPNYTLNISLFLGITAWNGPQSGHTLWAYNKKVNSFNLRTTYSSNGTEEGTTRPFSWYACGY